MTGNISKGTTRVVYCKYKSKARKFAFLMIDGAVYFIKCCDLWRRLLFPKKVRGFPSFRSPEYFLWQPKLDIAYLWDAREFYFWYVDTRIHFTDEKSKHKLNCRNLTGISHETIAHCTLQISFYGDQCG